MIERIEKYGMQLFGGTWKLLENISHILYHCLIVIFPFLLYYFFAIRNNYYSSTIHNGKLLGMMIVILLLTMSFPVSYANGFVYDFRIIPIIVSFLYIGLFQGIIAIFIMLLYLHIFNEPNFILFFVNYTVLTLALYFIRAIFRGPFLKNKLIVISGLFWVMTGTRSITLFIEQQFQHLFIMVIFSIITWITLVLVILLIENLIQQMYLQKELKRSEKLNLISQLAASVAHEVRNPMTTINGFLQLIKKDENITEQQRSYIDISLAELSRAQDIINDYLSLAKPNPKEAGLVNISEELPKVIALMTSYTNIQNIEVTSSIEASLYVKGNRDEIKQVLINIIKNGIEAMKTKGKLEIVAYSVHDHVMIKIVDNGEGMTKEQLSRVGTPFYSTKDMGTGIGLTISFQIIEQLKGNIEVMSEVETGTTFLIKLPLCQADVMKSEFFGDRMEIKG